MVGRPDQLLYPRRARFDAPMTPLAYARPYFARGPASGGVRGHFEESILSTFQSSLRRSTLLAAALIAALAGLLATALAQPLVGPVEEVTTVVTGRVSFEVDGVAHEYEVMATYYPLDYGEDVANETARRFMRAVAGSSMHTVTWNSLIMEVMGMTIDISENLQVQVSADGPAVDEGLKRSSIGFSFEVDPETLVFDPSGSFSLTFTPVLGEEAGLLDYFYANSDDDLVMEAWDGAWITDRGFSIGGSFSGTLLPSDFAKVLEGQVSITGTFEFEWVDGGTEFTDAFVEEVLDQAE